MKTKHIIFLALFAAGLFLAPQNSSAQFTKSSMLIGPHIGLAAYSSAPLFGANFEVGVTEPGKAGPGIIGIGGRVDYFSYSYFTDWTFTWITVGVTGNYHFQFDDKKWDPFLGLEIGYEHVSWSAPGVTSYTSPWGNGIFIAPTAGARYFFSPNFAARAQLGFSISYLVLGVDFGIN
jgi:hypothetical protein